MKINIIFYSSTGNTEEMANIIGSSAREEGAEVKLITIDSASLNDIKNCDIVLLGSPAMGAENLEEGEVEPFIEEIEGDILGKKMVLFGSYGWGGGAFMDEWEERMESNGAELLEKGVTVKGMPEGKDKERLIEIGKKIVKK